MGLIFLGAKIFYEEREMTKALIIAFIVSSFINPYAIRSISYQMSYLALIGILFLYPKVKELLGGILPDKFNKVKVIDFLILSFSIQLILIPLFLYYFRVLPLFSFLPNLIVIPLGSILVQVLFIALLLSFVGLGGFLIPLGFYLYQLLIFIINTFFKVTAEFNLPNSSKTLRAELNKKFDKENEAVDFLNKCNNAGFSIDIVEKKAAKRSPAPPFTTSTL